MTQPIDDELLSAVLDGSASEAEQARVAADAHLSRRLALLASARARLAAGPPSGDPGARARAIALALGAASPAALGTAPETVDVPAPPTPLAARRGTRRWLAVGTAAAGLVAVVAVGSVLAARGGGDTVGGSSATREATASTTPANDSAATVTDATATAGGGSGAPEMAASSGPAPPAPAQAQDAPLPDLGAVDARSLPVALAALASKGAVDARTADASRCPAPTSGSQAAAVATWEGRAAIVFVTAAPSPTAIVVVVDGCSPVSEVPLT